MGIARLTAAFLTCDDMFAGRNVMLCARSASLLYAIRCDGLSHRVGGSASISATYRVVRANAVLHHDVSPIFWPRGDTNCGKMASAVTTIRPEKMRYVAVRRHDTLCVRRVFSLFLLQQSLRGFNDNNPGRKTTLIVTNNNYDHCCVQRLPGKKAHRLGF